MRKSSAGLVSVIIPSTLRTSLESSIRSVRAQGVENEIILVIDRDEKECAGRPQESLKNVKILYTGGQKGGGFARELGLRAATGEYSAFLDDDDVWLPNKLDLQAEALKRAAHPENTLVLCRALIGRPGSWRIVPRRIYENHTQIENYLFQRSRVRFGDSMMQSSCLFGRTETLLRIGWDPELKKHQDWDLVIRARNRGIELLTVSKPLVMISQGSPGSVSGASKWQMSLAWFDSLDPGATGRAHGDFLYAIVLRSALRERSRAGLWQVIRRTRLCRAPHFGAVVVGLSGILDGVRPTSGCGGRLHGRKGTEVEQADLQPRESS